MEDEVIYLNDYSTEQEWLDAKYQLQINGLVKFEVYSTKEELQKRDFESLDDMSSPWRTAKRIEIVIYTLIGFRGFGIITYEELLSIFEKYFGKKISSKSLQTGLNRLKKEETIITTRVGGGKVEYFLQDVERWIPAYIKKHSLV